MPITLINRSQGSGTRVTFEEYGLKGHESATAQEQDSSGTVRQIVSSTPGAISYVSFGYFNKVFIHSISMALNQPKRTLWTISGRSGRMSTFTPVVNQLA